MSDATTTTKAGELHLRVVTPEKVVCDRPAKSVQFMGEDGSYGILPKHAALITATTPGVLTITEVDGSQSEMLVTDGFAEVQGNVVTVVCEEGETAADIDVDAAARAEQEAREQIAAADKALPKAEAALRKALLAQAIGRRRSSTGNVR